MKQQRKNGIVITEADGTPLTSGQLYYWDAALSNIIMKEAGNYFPDADFQLNASSEKGEFTTVFRRDDAHGTELCGTSVSLEKKGVKIPERELDAFIDSLDHLHQQAEREDVPEDTRNFIQSFRLPSPWNMKSAWRQTTGFTRHLLVLWGYTTLDSEATILPLTPTSAKWKDAGDRIDLRKQLQKSISKGSFNWGKLFRWIVWILLILLLVWLLCTCLKSCALLGSGSAASSIVPGGCQSILPWIGGTKDADDPPDIGDKKSGDGASTTPGGTPSVNLNGEGDTGGTQVGADPTGDIRNSEGDTGGTPSGDGQTGDIRSSEGDTGITPSGNGQTDDNRNRGGNTDDTQSSNAPGDNIPGGNNTGITQNNGDTQPDAPQPPMIAKCPECGTPLDKNGKCPRCSIPLKIDIITKGMTADANGRYMVFVVKTNRDDDIKDLQWTVESLGKKKATSNPQTRQCKVYLKEASMDGVVEVTVQIECKNGSVVTKKESFKYMTTMEVESIR